MADSRPLVSVIIPAYNASGFIGEAIGSLKAQSFRDFEAIIIDDGSSDGTSDVATVAFGGDPRFRLARQGNAGVSSARNLGLDLAVGEWVTFLDADDFFDPSFIEELVGAASDTTDIVIAGARVVGRGERLLQNYGDTVLGREGLKSISLRLLDERPDEKTKCNLEILGCICSKLYRRYNLEQMKFDERIRMREDAVFNLEAFCRARSAAVITSCGYAYRSASGTASLSFHPDYDKEIDAFCEDCGAVWAREGFSAESLHRGVLYSYMSWLKLYALHPDNGLGRAQRRDAIRRSFDDERWRGSFEALAKADLDLPYALLRSAFLSKSVSCVAALKYLNDVRKGLKWR